MRGNPPLGTVAGLVGLAAWGLGTLWLRPGLAESLLLLGPLVAVPLGLELVAPGADSGHRLAGRWRVAALLQLPAAALLLVSCGRPPGPVAAALTLPWLACCALVALLGILRLVEQGPRPMGELSVDAGLVFLAVGGTWLLFSRWGRPLLGFGEPLALLTAAHFHFAGFALAILTGLAGRALPGRLASLAAAGVVTGVPLVALGISLSVRGVHLVEGAAAWWLAAATLLGAALYLRLALRERRRPRGLLAALAGLSLAGGMSLAAVYALGLLLGRPWLDIPTMVRTHAVLNVLGFALPALLFWRLAGPPPERAGFQVLLPWLGDRPDLEVWERRGFAAGTELGPRPGDARDCHEQEAAREAPGPPQPAGPHRRAAAAIGRGEIFPPRLLLPVVRRTPVSAGDTVALRCRVLPGVAILFAARVTAVFDEAAGDWWRSGFTYRTLAGHPFAGEETFAVEKHLATGEVRVAIESWSRPEGFFVRLAYPWARRLQLAGGRAGAEHLRRLALGDAAP
jgi:uncharacterized protein (UPF0548 family)